MSNFNFGAMQVRTKASKSTFGKSKKAPFTGMKYQVNNDGKFTFELAKPLFNELGLLNKSLMFAILPENVVIIAVVSEDNPNASIYRKSKSVDGKKSTKFNSINLKSDLLDQGLITEVDATLLESRKPSRQYLSLTPLVQEGIPEYMEKVFVVGAETSTEVASEEVAETPEEVIEEVIEEVEETPVVEEAQEEDDDTEY